MLFLVNHKLQIRGVDMHLGRKQRREARDGEATHCRTPGVHLQRLHSRRGVGKPSYCLAGPHRQTHQYISHHRGPIFQGPASVSTRRRKDCLRFVLEAVSTSNSISSCWTPMNEQRIVHQPGTSATYYHNQHMRRNASLHVTKPQPCLQPYRSPPHPK
jgi:hypothetical protein